jgi:hypothetical protein
MKTSKDKMRLEAYLNCYADQFQLQREYRFHPVRKWRFDWALMEPMVAVEFEGGVFLGRGHTGGVIYGQNCEKYNTAALMGWRVLRFTAPMIRAGMHETMIKEAIAGRRVGGEMKTKTFVYCKSFENGISYVRRGNFDPYMTWVEDDYDEMYRSVLPGFSYRIITLNDDGSYRDECTIKNIEIK